MNNFVIYVNFPGLNGFIATSDAAQGLYTSNLKQAQRFVDQKAAIITAQEVDKVFKSHVSNVLMVL